jgi:hypothetical protein
MLPCEGTNNSTSFIDYSAFPKTITPAGDAKVTTSIADYFGRTAGVATFDGTGDVLTVNSALLNGTTWTVEMLVRPTSLSTTNKTLFSQYLSTDANRTIFDITTAGALRIFNGAQGSNISASNALTLNAWNFVTFIRSGSTVTGYVGTTQVVQKINFIGPYNGNTMFGGYFGFPDDQFVGQMQMIRVTNATRTVAIPTSPFPRL